MTKQQMIAKRNRAQDNAQDAHQRGDMTSYRHHRNIAQRAQRAIERM